MSSKNKAGWLNLDKPTLEAQRAARSLLKRDVIILMILILGGVATSLFLIIFMNQTRAIYFILPFYLIIYMISNWRQWNAFLRFKLRCPHCGHALAEKVKLYKSPNHNCPNCGKRALASIRQLKHQGVSN